MQISLSFIKQPGPAVRCTADQARQMDVLNKRVNRALDTMARLHQPVIVTVTYDIQRVPE